MLEDELKRTKDELDLQKTVPNARAQGNKGEELVARLTGGSLTRFGDSCDVVVRNGNRLQVKFSAVTRPNPGKTSKTKRWTWSNVLGRPAAENYDLLVLVGEKDARYESQYPLGSPCVFFLVPQKDVGTIVSGNKGTVALNTNLATAKSPTQEALKLHLVSAVKIRELGRAKTKQ